VAKKGHKKRAMGSDPSPFFMASSSQSLSVFDIAVWVADDRAEFDIAFGIELGGGWY